MAGSNNHKKHILTACVVSLGVAFVGLSILAKKKKPDSVYADKKEEQNPLEGKKVRFVENENEPENADGVRGHLEAIDEAKESKNAKKIEDLTDEKNADKTENSKCEKELEESEKIDNKLEEQEWQKYCECRKHQKNSVELKLEKLSSCRNDEALYSKYIKRGLDFALSFGGLVVLSPVMGAIALAIKAEDPGPAFFTQKRVGQDKQYFKLHKFRSMKMSTPHDVPTHMLDNPDQYITKVGKFIRAHSLDELPQIWDIFIGNMSVIGPRPALWNQDLLVSERDKYGANDVKPGLTGWAQINGRDELEIVDKAKLDGDYAKKLGQSGWDAWKMDAKCFLGSVHVLHGDDSVVEGGTGEMKKTHKYIGRDYTAGKTDAELIGHIGFDTPVQVDKNAKKKILITGKGSYIGQSFIAYAGEHYTDNFEIDELDMQNPTWRDADFSKYDIVYHVAGIAHADVGHVSDETKELYYQVNTDLAIETAKKAKEAGVKEFIFMSSMIVYGDSAPYGQKKVIDANTVPAPVNFYGDSKLQADVAVRDLADEHFKVMVLRPPMIYGKGSKGNYQTLVKLAKKLPVFPDVKNARSMLYIENLCEFLCQVMLVKMKERGVSEQNITTQATTKRATIERDVTSNKVTERDVAEQCDSAQNMIAKNAIVLVPQNAEWTCTSEMVKEIANVCGKKIMLSKAMMPAVAVAGKLQGKIGGLTNKAFGNNCYAKSMSRYEGIRYQYIGLRGSVYRSERMGECHAAKGAQTSAGNASTKGNEDTSESMGESHT